MFPPHELALADFARHLSLLLASAPPVPTLDTLQRLVGFGLDPLKVEGGQPIQIGGDRVLEIGEAGLLRLWANESRDLI